MLNPFFLQGSNSEQNLVQDLINEQLRMYGVEVYYLPRRYVTEKTIIREVIESQFVDAYPLEAYVENYEGYEGNTTILSKFGIQSSQEISLIISQERFETYITPLIKNKPNIKLSTRPKEGDLIYFPLGDRLFEIKFVEHEKPFYQLQKNYVYLLKCELFRYEDEVINTDIDEIDNILIGEDGGTTEDGIDTVLGQTQTLTLVGVGITATAITNIVNGAIRNIRVTNRGGGYSGIPIVGISSAPSGGITGTAFAEMIGGIVVCTDNINPSLKSVQSIRLINAGAGYTVTPGVKFIGGGGSGATAVAGIGTTGAVGITTITLGGSGYVSAPTVTFSTPKHVGAAATAVINSPIGVGVSVLRAVISIGSSQFLFPGGTTGGVFYKTAPTVTFSLPTGSGNAATATATLDNYNTTGGTVLSIGITSEGKFYNPASPPTVTISSPGSSTAVATIGIAGSSISPGSIAFTTTGRAYTVAPIVAISTGGVFGNNAPTITAIGIATIHPITGIVTAVSFNVSDSWAVSTGATIGAGYTVAPQITFSGSTSATTATATASVSAAGTITSISIGNSGYGYISTPTVTISSPTGANEAFRALGIATIRFNSISTTGTLAIGSTEITGINTSNIIVGDRVRLAIGHSESYNFISDSYVSQIGVGTIFMSSAGNNVGIATSVFEFGIDQCGIVTGIAVTFGGGGYIIPPTVTISNNVSEKNYINIISGISTATGISTVNSAGIVTAIYVTDSGYGYVIVPTITIGNPSMTSSGTFIFNETVTGSSSGTTAKVRTWSSITNVLEVSNVSGAFVIGENIVGTASSASHQLRNIDLNPNNDGFADNSSIETEADSIIDFSEKNPFGTP